MVGRRVKAVADAEQPLNKRTRAERHSREDYSSEKDKAANQKTQSTLFWRFRASHIASFLLTSLWWRRATSRWRAYTAKNQLVAERYGRDLPTLLSGAASGDGGSVASRDCTERRASRELCFRTKDDDPARAPLADGFLPRRLSSPASCHKTLLVFSALEELVSGE
ncbi:hypothetical protein MRX96_017206 [Rhipicephalus microplus]